MRPPTPEAPDQEEITPEELEQLAADNPLGPGYECPECGEHFRTPLALGAHRRHKHGVAAQSRVRSSKRHKGKAREGDRRDQQAAESVAGRSAAYWKRLEDKTVANLTTVGVIGSAFLPHFGLTVASRSPKSGALLMRAAQRDERVRRGIEQFNGLFELSEGAELVLSHVAALGVDSGRVDPDLAFEVGALRIEPVRQLIGDVVDEVTRLRAAQEQQRAEAEAMGGESPNGQHEAQSAAEVIPGGFKAT